jgi:peptidoglycan/LPS O-acetylase OafA/YrhL
MVKEQFISLVTVLLLATASLLKKFQSKFLILLGIYSYEIYLIQWPLVLHYDLFYQYFPASIATILYLRFYLALGFCLKKLTQSLFLKKL